MASSPAAAAPAPTATSGGIAVGLELVHDALRDATGLDEVCRLHAFAFGLIPIVAPAAARARLADSHEAEVGPDADPPFAFAELCVPEPAPTLLVQAAAGAFLDDPDDAARRRAEALLRRELAWAAYVGIAYLVVPCPPAGP
ncbi:hypothetical protein HK405_015591, partial [Cladochytrium tenue]